MAAKCFVVLACLALAQAALVKRETPNLMQELQEHAAEFQKTLSEQFTALINSKNSQDWQKSVKESTNTVATQISSLSSSLESAIADASGKAKEALETSRANLQKTADELRTAHPEVEAQATQLKDKMAAAVQNAVQETQKLAKEVAANAEQTNQKLAPTVKQAYDDFVKQMQDVQKKLHEAANKQ